MSVGAGEGTRLCITGATGWAALWRDLVVARARCLDDGSALLYWSVE
jgi:hypothetical protein